MAVEQSRRALRVRLQVAIGRGGSGLWVHGHLAYCPVGCAALVRQLDG